MADPMLRIEDITHSFNGVVANDGISLAVERGACHGIIGPNGSGKTTLFDVVSGVYSPDEGRVRFDGEDITGDRPDTIARRGLVRTFQIVSPFEKLTVKQNLLGVFDGGSGTALRISAEKRDRADSILSMLDLESVASNEAGDISGGQQRLLELGRALMLEPDCILLDEPTAGVNPSIQERLIGYLREVNERGTTLLIIEHDLNVVGALTDETTVLDRGRVIGQGSLSELAQEPTVRDAYLGQTSPAAKRDDASAAHSYGDRDEFRPTVRPNDHRQDAAPSKEDGSLLVAEDIVTGYGNQRVLNGVSLRSHDGITAVFGPNGSGKSTLLDALAGVRPIWSGSVTYDGRLVTDLDPHQRVRVGIAMVPQDEELFGSLTVRENLKLGATTIKNKSILDERLEAVYRAFPPLEEATSTKARSLSGGQQVMLGFARAMMTDADVYLLDEPVSGLSPSAVDHVFEMIQTLVDRDAQVILVEQKVREALEIADKVYVMAQGEIRFDGTPEELEDEDELVDLYLGLS